MKKISLSTEAGIRYVNPTDINYIEAEGSYSKVKLIDGSSVLLSRLLKDFEMLLDNSGFYRNSKSSLINICSKPKKGRFSNKYDGIHELITKQNHICHTYACFCHT